MKNDYAPSTTILRKYAQVLVNFALNSGKGVKAGEVVELSIPDVAKPLAKEIHKAILKAQAHPIIKLVPTGGFKKDFFELANQDQLTHFPSNFLKAKAEMLDHTITIIADTDPYELKDIASSKVLTLRKTIYPYREWLFQKEYQQKFSWTVALYGTQAQADIVGLSLEEYWQQIIKACFLDKKDPVSHWQELVKLQKEIQKKLNALSITSIKVVGKDINLTVKIGAERAWETGGGVNIPSFEHFTSPNWRGTNGWIKFNQPLYIYGNFIEGIALEFKDGLVTKATATKGEAILKNMIETKNANKVGEFSLTDKRLSRITHPMANTLYDENIGGRFGNTHIALGNAYKSCYKNDVTKVTKAKWDKMGYNQSAIHTDIVSTTNRTATATLVNGGKVVIYKDGQFVL